MSHLERTFTDCNGTKRNEVRKFSESADAWRSSPQVENLNAKGETERFSKLEMGGARIAVKLQSGVSTSDDRSKVQQGKALREDPS